ncbi:30S ribosomal protein S12 methylthiotransferase RimO [Evtepia sp.]|uniref:30S ribosomal protein S12 methylthiotransferase RimO n=1 Tax=Evtepia sp. TaxID=2773933 RepID=UPI002A7ED99A|nr:30S ribosomal protein S12 methylthiotransferase RimO [Evtepia sp.]MDY4431274.1 30S ribosomal protein S12 methylthiotransferase RimO [Evtepia sp.]
MKVGFISLGCAKNQVNCEQMIWQTYEAGHEVALGAEDCDVAVVNTCGFLQEARDEAMAEIEKLAELKRAGKLKKIIVTGCMAQWKKEEMKTLCPDADGFIGVGGYDSIAQVLEQAEAGERPALFGDIDAPVPETDRVVCTSDYWAWLRIAEGCDNRCAYCVIPFIRGRFRSRPEEKILEEARNLAEAGMKELIVVAQDITRYGLDLYGRRTLAELLPKLCAIEGIQWVRLHYLYPDEITDELIDVIAREPKIVKYLDIPIQHISDKVLKAMHRRGTGDEIRVLFRKLRQRIPGLVLRTSLIAGFPGETEEDFEELCEFLLEYKIERAGVFPYSPEPGSAAASYPDQVDEDVKRRRVELLTDLQLRVVDQFCQDQVGKTLTVLCEGYDDETELYFGRSQYDSPEIDGIVHFEGEEGGVAPGGFYQVKITSTYDGELIGVIDNEEAEA